MFIQQGDVLFKKIKSIPGNLKRVARRNNGFGAGRYVVAEGETTGHHHSTIQECELFEDVNGTLYIRNASESPIIFEHQEHGAVEVPTGDFEIGIVKEYDHFEEKAREVRD